MSCPYRPRPTPVLVPGPCSAWQQHGSSSSQRPAWILERRRGPKGSVGGSGDPSPWERPRLDCIPDAFLFKLGFKGFLVGFGFWGVFFFGREITFLEGLRRVLAARPSLTVCHQRRKAEKRGGWRSKSGSRVGGWGRDRMSAPPTAMGGEQGPGCPARPSYPLPHQGAAGQGGPGRGVRGGGGASGQEVGHERPSLCSRQLHPKCGRLCWVPSCPGSLAAQCERARRGSAARLGPEQSPAFSQRAPLQVPGALRLCPQTPPVQPPGRDTFIWWPGYRQATVWFFWLISLK